MQRNSVLQSLAGGAGVAGRSRELIVESVCDIVYCISVYWAIGEELCDNYRIQSSDNNQGNDDDDEKNNDWNLIEFG